MGATPTESTKPLMLEDNKFEWTHHALRRLQERSSLTQAQAEKHIIHSRVSAGRKTKKKIRAICPINGTPKGCFYIFAAGLCFVLKQKDVRLWTVVTVMPWDGTGTRIDMKKELTT